MANVTDPLACPIHGTNPQNLIEYITRQRIYDSQYWKEECFGLNAADVTEKAAIHLQAIGGSYGGNSKPTRFLCLILKMLQIQPDEGIVDELINNADFKYVTALGAFYLRLTGRPAEIYEKLEPLYNDYRKLKFRNPADWKLMYMDELIDQLLKDNRVCGIALPRLPKREMLEEAGYLDGPRVSAVQSIICTPGMEEQEIRNVTIEQCVAGGEKIKALLEEMADDGNTAATEALQRRRKISSNESKEDSQSKITKKRKNSAEVNFIDEDKDERCDKHENTPSININIPPLQNRNDESRHGQGIQYSNRKKEKKSKEKKYGSLFKSSQSSSVKTRHDVEADKSNKGDLDVNSDEYWNEQRAKLGLKPLK